MKIIYLKSGNFAFHPARGPVQTCAINKIEDIKDQHAIQLIDAKWAKPYVELPPPWKRENWNPNDENAKQQLEDYVNDKYGETLDKRKAVSTLIREVRKIIKQNG